MVEFGQPRQQGRPGDVGVSLHENEPLRIRLVFQSLLRHGQELPFIQLPAWVVGLANGGIGLVCEIVFLQTLPPAPGETVVDVEVGDLARYLRVHVFQDIVDLDAFDLLVEVGVDHVVWDAAECCREVDGDFVFGFCYASLHHDEDIVNAWEGRAEWRWFAADIFEGGIATGAGGGGGERSEVGL